MEIENRLVYDNGIALFNKDIKVLWEKTNQKLETETLKKNQFSSHIHKSHHTYLKPFTFPSSLSTQS